MQTAANTARNPLSNRVGYGHFTVPNNYSINAPVFKNVGGGQFYLSQITPCTPSGVTITGNGKVTIFKLKDDGKYDTSYMWCPATCGGWSADSGATKIADNAVPLAAGEGFGMSNLLKVDASGNESTARSAVPSPATMLTSGEVDLVCKNAVPYNYSISANSTPVKIYLSQITPCTPKGVTITGNGKVTIFKLKDDGKYDTSYMWCPATCGGWSADSGTTKIADDAVPLEPGEGFGMSNLLKVDASGNESTARTAVASPAMLSLPAPIAK